MRGGESCHVLGIPLGFKRQPRRRSARLGYGGKLINLRCYFLDGTAWPEDLNGIGPRYIAQTNCNGKLGLGEIAAGGHDLPGEGLAVDANFDPCADGIAI